MVTSAHHMSLSWVPKDPLQSSDLFQFEAAYSVSWDVKFLWLGFFSPSPNPQAVGHHFLQDVHACLFNICAATVHFFGGFLRHPQPEETSCCGDRDHLIREIEM